MRARCNGSGASFDGTNYFVVWVDNRDFTADIYGSRINTSGTVLDPTGIPIATSGLYERFPSLAFDGTNHLVTWEAQPLGGGDADIWGARIDRSGTVLDQIQITNHPSVQFNPGIAFDGNNFVVVWYDYRSGGDLELYGSRVAPSGTLLDTFTVSTVANRTQALPALCRGPGQQVICAYNGYLTSPYMAMRIVGRFLTYSAISENVNFLPAKLILKCQPNPFSKNTKILYQLSQNATVRLALYNGTGRLVKVLENKFQKAGAYSINWDGKDGGGTRMPAGVYFLNLRIEDNEGRCFSRVTKIIAVE